MLNVSCNMKRPAYHSNLNKQKFFSLTTVYYKIKLFKFSKQYELACF